METTTTKLFVGGLPRDITDESLSQHFAKYGEVTQAVVKRSYETGVSRGFGFVIFAAAASAQRAMEPGEDHIILGKKVDVKVAKDLRHRIFVGGLRLAFTADDLREHFTAFGNITDAIVVKHKDSEVSKGYGFVIFDSEDAMARALEHQHHTMQGRAVDVRRARRRRYNYNYQSMQHTSYTNNHHVPYDSYSTYEHTYPQQWLPNFYSFHVPWYCNQQYSTTY